MAEPFDSIKAEIDTILDWNIKVKKEGSKVPEKGDLTLGETAVSLDTCVLFVDMRQSSALADDHRKTTAAKIYNAYLNAMIRIAASNWGRVRSFNGDGVLFIFDPDMPNIVCSKAVDTAMYMIGAASYILRPALSQKGYEDDFQIGVGITNDNILVTKAGLRGDTNNDLIWPCNGVNLAAKLANLAQTNEIITYNIYPNLKNENDIFGYQSGSKVNIWQMSSYKFNNIPWLRIPKIS